MVSIVGRFQIPRLLHDLLHAHAIVAGQFVLPGFPQLRQNLKAGFRRRLQQIIENPF